MTKKENDLPGAWDQGGKQGGSKDGPAAQVEWRIKRNLSILSRITGQGGSKLSVRWRKDY